MLYKSGAAGQEPYANAARDKGLNQSFDQGERGGRELRWREEAGANQLWFSVSCWDVYREREGGCSCGVERSVKPKKCHSHYTSLFPRPSACLFLRTSLLFFLPLPFTSIPLSPPYTLPLFHMFRAASKLSVLIKRPFGPVLSAIKVLIKPGAKV